MENMLIMNPPTSESICAASVRIAKEPEMRPPIISTIMKAKQIMTTIANFLNALSPILSFD